MQMAARELQKKGQLLHVQERQTREKERTREEREKKRTILPVKAGYVRRVGRNDEI